MLSVVRKPAVSCVPLASLVLAGVVACSGEDLDLAASTQGTGGGASSTSSTGGSGTTGSGEGGAGLVGEGITTYETQMELTVQPGEERTECVRKRLPNPEGAFIRRFRATLTAASHHMIVYRSTATTEQLDPQPCTGFSGLLSGDHPIFIAQQDDATLVFPKEGASPVGLEIEPNQMLLLEMHYINATASPIDAVGVAYIDTVPLDDNVVPSDLGFYGTQNINIPPNASWSTPVKFQLAPEGTKSFALTTHQHHYGTRMQVWHAASKNDKSTPVADSKNWADPPLEIFDPPLEFPVGAGMGFAYQCEWTNTSPVPVGFGESANDEMCFLWHYYYPSQGFRLCVDGFCL